MTLKSGKLFKLSQNLFGAKWNEKWIQLEDTSLRCYAFNSDQVFPLTTQKIYKIIHLQEYQLSSFYHVVEKKLQRPFCFQLIPKDNIKKPRIFACGNEREYREWMEVLMKCTTINASPNPSTDEYKQLQMALNAFDKLDGKYNGKIESTKLKGLLEAIHYPTPVMNMDQILQIMDPHLEGKISRENFIIWFQKCYMNTTFHTPLTTTTMVDIQLESTDNENSSIQSNHNWSESYWSQLHSIFSTSANTSTTNSNTTDSSDLLNQRMESQYTKDYNLSLFYQAFHTFIMETTKTIIHELQLPEDAKSIPPQVINSTRESTSNNSVTSRQLHDMLSQIWDNHWDTHFNIVYYSVQDTIFQCIIPKTTLHAIEQFQIYQHYHTKLGQNNRHLNAIQIEIENNKQLQSNIYIPLTACIDYYGMRVYIQSNIPSHYRPIFSSLRDQLINNDNSKSNSNTTTTTAGIPMAAMVGGIVASSIQQCHILLDSFNLRPILKHADSQNDKRILPHGFQFYSNATNNLKSAKTSNSTPPVKRHSSPTIGTSSTTTSTTTTGGSNQIILSNAVHLCPAIAIRNTSTDNLAVVLRPEFLIQYPHGPLFANANRDEYYTNQLEEMEQKYELVKAISYLELEICMKAVLKFQYNIYHHVMDSYTITKVLHEDGINMKYLGRLYSCSTLKYVKRLLLIEIIARTCKQVLRLSLAQSMTTKSTTASTSASSTSHSNCHTAVEMEADMYGIQDNMMTTTYELIVIFFNLVLSMNFNELLKYATTATVANSDVDHDIGHNTATTPQYLHSVMETSSDYDRITTATTTTMEQNLRDSKAFWEDQIFPLALSKYNIAITFEMLSDLYRPQLLQALQYHTGVRFHQMNDIIPILIDSNHINSALNASASSTASTTIATTKASTTVNDSSATNKKQPVSNRTIFTSDTIFEFTLEPKLKSIACTLYYCSQYMELSDDCLARERYEQGLKYVKMALNVAQTLPSSIKHQLLCCHLLLSAGEVCLLLNDTNQAETFALCVIEECMPQHIILVKAYMILIQIYFYFKLNYLEAEDYTQLAFRTIENSIGNKFHPYVYDALYTITEGYVYCKQYQSAIDTLHKILLLCKECFYVTTSSSSCCGTSGSTSCGGNGGGGGSSSSAMTTSNVLYGETKYYLGQLYEIMSDQNMAIEMYEDAYLIYTQLYEEVYGNARHTSDMNGMTAVATSTTSENTSENTTENGFNGTDKYTNPNYDSERNEIDAISTVVDNEWKNMLIRIAFTVAEMYANMKQYERAYHYAGKAYEYCQLFYTTGSGSSTCTSTSCTSASRIESINIGIENGKKRHETMKQGRNIGAANTSIWRKETKNIWIEVLLLLGIICTETKSFQHAMEYKKQALVLLKGKHGDDQDVLLVKELTAEIIHLTFQELTPERKQLLKKIKAQYDTKMNLNDDLIEFVVLQLYQTDPFQLIEHIFHTLLPETVQNSMVHNPQVVQELQYPPQEVLCALHHLIQTTLQ